jgi:hypothetical protein
MQQGIYGDFCPRLSIPKSIKMGGGPSLNRGACCYHFRSAHAIAEARLTESTRTAQTYLTSYALIAPRQAFSTLGSPHSALPQVHIHILHIMSAAPSSGAAPAAKNTASPDKNAPPSKDGKPAAALEEDDEFEDFPVESAFDSF